MMIDDDTLKQLLRINDELLQLQVTERKAGHGDFVAAHTYRDELTHILLKAGKNKLH